MFHSLSKFPEPETEGGRHGGQESMTGSGIPTSPCFNPSRHARRAVETKTHECS